MAIGTANSARNHGPVVAARTSSRHIRSTGGLLRVTIRRNPGMVICAENLTYACARLRSSGGTGFGSTPAGKAIRTGTPREMSVAAGTVTSVDQTGNASRR